MLPQNTEFALCVVAQMQGMRSSHVITLALDQYIQSDLRLKEAVIASLGKFAEGYQLEVESVKHRKSIVCTESQFARQVQHI
ncbi:MAG: hypothetical protein WCO60_17070 [Verrucomicrobiota bacterium]